jgi:hypothetical protein
MPDCSFDWPVDCLIPALDHHVNEETMTNAFTENHRRARRYAVKLPCLVKARKSGRNASHEIQAETHDVSRSGLFFFTFGEWKLGGRIECKLRFRGPGFQHPVTVRCKGKIARLVPRQGGLIGVAATIDTYEFPARYPGAFAWTNEQCKLANAS